MDNYSTITRPSKKKHLTLICDEAQLLRHPALEHLPLLLNFDMIRPTTPLPNPGGRTLTAPQAVAPDARTLAPAHCRANHLDGLSREGLDSYFNHQLKAAGDQYMLHFNEKGGKSREIPVRHDLEGMTREYILAASLGAQAVSDTFKL